MNRPGEITVLLRAHRDGERGALDRLVQLVYPDLRRISGRVLGGGGPQTLTATSVVHEAWLKLSADEQAAWTDRAHFLAVAARAMRQVIIDHARRRSAQKRGGDLHLVPLEDTTVTVEADADWLLSVHQAIERLARHHERLARHVEYRFFGGLEPSEIAAALGVSLRTVERDWPRARAWLEEAMRDPPDTEENEDAQ